MKLSFGVILLNQKILMSVILFSVILFYPFYYDEGYNETNNQKNESYEPEIVSGIVVVKLKSATSVHDLAKKSSATGIVSLDTKLKRYNTLGVEKMFKHKSIQEQSDIVGIDRIIKVKIPEDLNPIQVIKDLKSDPNVEYAEPIYKRYFFDIPNDPKYPEQDYLKQIKAPEAWDKQKGDSNVVIAINDGGVDLKHEDLKANLWTNEVEANGIPGIDDDNNGFIDDIHGWDFGDNDPDPSNPPSDIMYFDHGTHCAGIASAITDNNIGVSGVSWNCKIMPIKISSENAWPLIIGYYGIIYAADNGADIISNSWGGTGYLQWEQDVIDYAYSKGSIVVCATADIGGDILIYPSAYHHSISVAAVDVDDTKLWFSTYGPSIDICAPGNDILSTIPGNSYEIHMGTSMACPIVAGVFGLVKSLHQDWDNDQIIKQVLLSSDDINSKNPSFKNQLGHGRINAFRALTLSNLPEPDARFSLDSFEFIDSLYGDNDNVFEPGETVVLKTVLRNYSIGKANSASFILTCANPKIEILSGDHSGISFQADTTMQFEFLIKLNEELKSKNVELEISMETTMGYLRSETIPLTIGTNPVLLLDHDFGGSNQLAPFMQLESFYINILKQNNIPFTYWDCSKFGLPKLEYLFNYPIVIMFKEILEDYGTLPINSCKKIESYLNNGGNLFISGPNIGYNLYEWQPDQEIKDFMQKYLHAEFLANKSSDLLVEGIENDPISNGLSFNLWQPYLPNDFQSFDVIKPTNGATSLFIYGNGKTGAVKYSGNYKVIYLGFGLESVDSDENTKQGDMSPIRTKVLKNSLNWLNFIEHKPLKDTSEFSLLREVTAKVHSIGPKIKSMTLYWRQKGEGSFNSLLMQNNADTLFFAEIPGQSDSTIVEYYLESEFDYYTWTNPINAPENLYSYKVGHVTHIETEKNQSIEFNLSQNYPNPFNPTTNIKYSIANRKFVELKIYNVLGQEIQTLVNEEKPSGNYQIEFNAVNLPSGVYFYRIQAGSFNQVRKMLLIK